MGVFRKKQFFFFDASPKGSNKGKKEEELSIPELPVALLVTRSLKDKHERPCRIGDNMKGQMKIKSPKKEVGVAEASVSDLIGTRILKDNYKRPAVIGDGKSKFSRADGVCLSEANNNWPIPGLEPVGDTANDDEKLVDRVKWRLARMEERLSRGEVNADLVRKIEDVKEKLWRFKYLTWLKNRQMRPTRSGKSRGLVLRDSLSTWLRSGCQKADNVFQMTLQTSSYGLAESLERAVENEKGVLIQRKEIKRGRICVVLSGREEDVFKARALLRRNCQPQVEMLSKSDSDAAINVRAL